MPTRSYRHLLLLPLAILMASVGFFALKSPDRQKPATNDTPEACINRLLKAEDAGDTQAYFDCFSPDEKAALQTRWKHKSANQISADLRNQSTPLVGRAVTDLQLLDTSHAQLIIERITKDDVARQKVTLERETSRWQITSLGSPERHQPKIPYGTPVFKTGQ